MLLLFFVSLFFVVSIAIFLRYKNDNKERKRYELTVVNKSFLPPSTRNKKASSLKIHLLLTVWLLKKNSVYSVEKQSYAVNYLIDKFKLSEHEAKFELLGFMSESIHIRSVANWVVDVLKSREERADLLEFLISMLYAAKTDVIDREFTALVRFAELIGVQAIYVENRIIEHRKQLLGDTGASDRWHKFTNKQVRRKLALAVFGLLGNASDEEVKVVYRKLVKLYHPDRQMGKSEEEKLESANKFLEIQEAYEELLQQES